MIVNRNSLASALKAVSGAVSRNSPQEAFRCVLLDGPRGQIYATNREIAASVRLDMSDSSDVVMLRYDDISRITNASSGDDVVINPDGNAVLITTGGAHYTLPAGDAETMPTWDDVETLATFEFSSGPLKDAIAKTRFAAAKESTKYTMNCLAMLSANSTTWLAATDSKRLSLVDLGCKDDPTVPNGSALLPMPFVDMLTHITDESITLAVGSNTITATFASGKFSARLVEGKFPPVFDIIPKKSNLRWYWDVAAWLAALRQVVAVVDDQSRWVKIDLAGGIAKLTCQGVNSGTATAQILNIAGTESFRVDPFFLIDALKSFDNDTIEVCHLESNRPLVFKQPFYQHLVMPLT